MKRVVSAALVLLAGVAGAQQPNDQCAGALPIYDGINPQPAASGVTFSNSGCVTDQTVTCVTSNSDVYFYYVSTWAGNHTFNTCTPTGFVAGTMSDTTIAAFDNCPGVQIACNDDSCGLRSSVTVNMTAGQLIWIRVASYSASAQGTFYVTVTPPPQPVTNDECVSGITVFDGANGPFGNTAATNSAESYGCGTFNNDVWFYYTATQSGLLNFSTGCGGFNTAVAVYDGCGGNELACNDDTPGCAVGGSTAQVAATAGLTYVVRVGAVAVANGTFTLGVSYSPANDECTGAIPVASGANGPFNNISATTSVGSTATCGSGGFNDVWFTYFAACGGQTQVDTGCLGFDVVTSVWDACGGTQLACDDDGPCGIGGSQVVFNATAGLTYMIRVGSYTNGASGSFNVTISGGALSFVFSSPLGPGSVQADVLNGTPFGAYIMALTLAPGAYPNGWLGGLDISIGDLIAQATAGFPFTGALGPCGEAQIGPFPGLPVGLQLWGTAVSMNALFGAVTGVAPATTITL